MRRSLITRRGILLAAPAIVLASALGRRARAQDGAKWQEGIIPGEALIRLAPDASASDVQRILDRHGAAIARSLTRADGPREYHVLLPIGREIDFDAELVGAGLAEFVHPAVPIANQIVPNDSSLSDGAIFDNWVAAIKAPAVWDRFKMVNFGAWPPVIDLNTGVQGTFSGGVFTSTHPDMGPISDTWNVTLNSKDVRDTNGHGTQVMGVMAAITNNSRAVPSVGWGGNGIAINDGNSSVLVIASMNWVIANVTPPGFVNLSQIFGSFPGQSFIDAGIALYNAGFLLVGATGDSGTSTCQFGVADIPNPYAVAVTAVNARSLKRASAYASYGPAAHAGGTGANACAPGGDISGIDGLQDDFDLLTLGSTYTSAQGTSASAPIVTGIARFLKTIAPDLTIAHIRALLTDQSLTQTTTGFGAFPVGCIDFDRLVTEVQRRSPISFQ